MDQCSRLHDSSISTVNFENDASEIAQVGLVFLAFVSLT